MTAIAPPMSLSNPGLDTMVTEKGCMPSDTDSESRLPPGTVHLIDLGRDLHVKHATGQQRDIILNPVPSQDPDDPLNWSQRRKLLSTFTLGVYTMTVAMGSAVTYAITVPMSKATPLTIADINTGTGYFFLLSGWCALICQPIALQYGKRPTYLLALLGHVAVMLWAPHARTNAQWIGNKILQGLCAAPASALGEITVADVYFTHERGRFIAIYGTSIVGGVYVSPIIFGFVEVGQSWQWVFYWMAIFSGIAFLICFFLMEETNFRRDEVVMIQDQTLVRSPVISSKPFERFGRKPPSHEETTSIETNSPQLKRKSYLQKLYIFDGQVFKRSTRPMRGMALRPFMLFRFPVVVYAGFTWGSALVWHAVLNATASLILSNPPYNFKADMVGLSFISGLIGVIAGSIYTGLFGDWFVIHMARRNCGLMEPEHRQWLFTVIVILLPGSLILWVSEISFSISKYLLTRTLRSDSAIGCWRSSSYPLDRTVDWRVCVVLHEYCGYSIKCIVLYRFVSSPLGSCTRHGRIDQEYHVLRSRVWCYSLGT